MLFSFKLAPTFGSVMENIHQRWSVDDLMPSKSNPDVDFLLEGSWRRRKRPSRTRWSRRWTTSTSRRRCSDASAPSTPSSSRRRRRWRRSSSAPPPSRRRCASSAIPFRAWPECSPAFRPDSTSVKPRPPPLANKKNRNLFLFIDAHIRRFI